MKHSDLTINGVFYKTKEEAYRALAEDNTIEQLMEWFNSPAQTIRTLKHKTGVPYISNYHVELLGHSYSSKTKAIVANANFLSAQELANLLEIPISTVYDATKRTKVKPLRFRLANISQRYTFLAIRLTKPDIAKALNISENEVERLAKETKVRYKKQY